MALSWNEIKTRANAFSKEWQDESREDAEAKSFWDAFFNIFGITRRRIASFEEPVKKSDGKGGFIDMLWRGQLLVEHKSRGKDLDRAFHQALDYFPGIKERDLPKYILVSDFSKFRLYNLETNEQIEFDIKDLYKNVKLFGFIAGYQTQIIKPQDPINVKAAERMGKLHDALKAVGYTGHDLEVYLVRLLFCLFSDDTTIFEKRLFQDYIETKTHADGSDLAHHINSLFYVLNTPNAKRLSNLDESLNAFPYVNGKLFAEPLAPAQFDSKMREVLLDLCALDWSVISPAIFGSLFQSIMDADARRNLGAHYTSEENILKLIKPLFLDALWAEFEKVKSNKNRLLAFHQKLRTLTFFDPACGCGNFLVITYRELRLLELAVLRAGRDSTQQVLDVQSLINVDVDQFYGIEIEEFPAQIAQVALWLTDHQMNMKISEEFGAYFARIPLKATPHILCANALQTDWASVLPAENCSYILGNPPFLGKSNQSPAQKADMQLVCGDIKNAGLLDFVSAWYVKAARYMEPSPCGRGQGEGATKPQPTPLQKIALPKEQLEFMRSLRTHQTDAENLMWMLLRDRRLANAKFRRQHPVGKYVLDFYCHEAKLAVELDGGQHLESQHDAVRDASLQQAGITVLRYWNNDVLANTESVLEDVWNKLQAGLHVEMDDGLSKVAPSPLPLSHREREIKCAFVSTNSITQGEQVGVLWGWMLAQGIKIHFAHRTFSWNNEARGKAAVHCVIIGFHLPSPVYGRGAGGEGELQKTIYEYDDIKGEPHAVSVSNINPYLVDAPDLIIEKSRHPICAVPEMTYGSKPADGGNLILTEAERTELLKNEPAAEQYIRPYIGSEELINGNGRYCLWLKEASPQHLRQMPHVMARIEAVRKMRLASTDQNTRNWAEIPSEFQTDRQPKSNYLALPEVSSERRKFMPIAYLPVNVVASNKLYTIENAGVYEFGMLCSSMHMVWTRALCGRLKSDYQYSASLVYNNFPWPPLSPSPFGRGARGEGDNVEQSKIGENAQSLPHPQSLSQGAREVKNIEVAAQAVLDARAAHPQASLADLYDPLTMPANLLKAHQVLDKAVDAAYSYKEKNTDAARVAFLFERYQALTSLLPSLAKTKKTRKAK